MKYLKYIIIITSFCLVACEQKTDDKTGRSIGESGIDTVIKLPEQGPLPSYSIYTWEEDKENNEIVILGENLFEATSIVIGNKRFDAISSDDGTLVRALLNEELVPISQPIWLNFGDKVAQLNEPYIPNKDDLPDYEDVFITDDIAVLEAFEEELTCEIDLESEAAIVITGRLNQYEARAMSPTLTIGNSIIPIEQFLIKGDTLKGYITGLQAEQLVNGEPIMFDGGTGFKKIADLRFQFPE